MPTVDPNVYALSIQLQLDSQEAFTTIDRFGESITTVEEQLASAADKALQGVDNIVKHVESSLTNVTNLINQIDISASKIATSFDSVNRSTTDTEDIDDKLSKSVLKQRDIWEEITEFHDDIKKSLNEHLKLHTDDIKLLKDIHKAIVVKNTGHEEQNQLIDSTNDGLTQCNQSIDDQKNKAKHLAKLWSSVTAAVNNLWIAIKKADEGTEAFVQTNYRAYGSQVYLLQSTRQLSAALGVTSEVAIATYKVLADVRTPREEIEKYASTIAMANRTTGASIQTLAIYSARMRSLGLTAGPLSDHIARLTEQMRKFGLTADDINRILSNTSSQQQNLRHLFAGNADAVREFEAAHSALAGIARDAGLSTDSIIEMQKTMSDPTAWIALGNRVGMNIQNMDDWKAGVLKFGSQLDDLQRQMDAASDPRQKLMYSAQIKGLSEAFLGNAEAGQVVIEMYRRASKESGHAADSATDYNTAMEALTKTLSDSYAEANNTLTAQLRILRESFGAMVSSIMAFIGDGLKQLLKPLNYVIQLVSWLVTSLMKWSNWIEDNIPVLGWFITILKIFAAVVVVVGVAIVALTGFVIGLVSAILLGIASITGFSGIISFVGQAIIATFQAMGQIFITLMTSMGQGLAILGGAIQPVIIPLLALGLALILVSVAAWVFAQAIAIVAEVGWAAVPAIFGLTLAIAILGTTLVLLGGLAQGPVALGMIVVAAVILAVGVAAVFMGYGLMLAAQAFQIMAGVVNSGIITQLPALALGLFLLGAASLFAAPGMVLLGVAILVFAVGMLIATPAIALLASIIESFPQGKLLEISTELLQASICLVAASAIVVVGAVLLAAASVVLLPAAILLLASSVVLLLAGTVLYPAAVVISMGVSLLLPASSELLSSAIALFQSGPLIMLGSLALLVGAVALLPASVMLLVSGAILLAGVFLLSMSSVSLLSVSNAVYTAGIKIGIGGVAMLVGMTALLGSARIMFTSSVTILFSAAALGAAVALLMPISGLVMVAGSLMAVGGARLRDGMTYIDDAARIMSTVGPILLSSSMLLLESSLAMMSAGAMLVPASFMIYLGLWWLEFEVYRFSKSIDQIKLAGEGMSKLAAAFALMNDVPVGKLKDAAASALSALPDIDELANGLDRSAIKLTEATERFAKPADELASVLERLGDVISQFGEGLTLADDVGQLAAMLDKYATLLEGASDRIETAVQTKAIPAMRAAERAGLQEAVRSEAITTVQVMTNSEGGESDSASMVDIATAQLTVLQELKETLSALRSEQSSGSIKEIVSLLQVHLPAMGKRESGLSTEFNAWAK